MIESLAAQAMMRRLSYLAFILILDVSTFSAAGAEPDEDSRWLAGDLSIEAVRGLPLEELLQIKVTSVAGTEQKWFKTPSAITVLNAEDIRRSGARSIAELMRLVPGMYVGRSGSHSWRIGARGFSGGLAPRNLVLIDGRVVYDPLFGGVFWEVQDVNLEDIDRIEVIRGPGSTLWGENAVNGVINIITKNAFETQGTELTAGAGTYERGFGSARYGGKVNDATAYRVYGKYFSRDAFADGTTQAQDDWSMVQGGFRLDHKLDRTTTFTVMGGGYGSPTMGEVSNGIAGDQDLSGAHILSRLEGSTAKGGWTVQEYYDRTNRQQASLNVSRDTFNVQFRNFFSWGNGNDFVWGFENRYSHDDTEASPTIVTDPETRTLNTASVFAQNTFTLEPDRWFLMLGSKFEYETYTGYHVEPSVRLWWTPDDRNTYWSAISRAVRTPSRLDNESAIGATNNGAFIPILLAGEDLDAEKLISYELGWRTRPKSDLLLDFSLFYSDYSDLSSFPPDISALNPAPWNNLGSGSAYGFEFSADWYASDHWRLIPSYSIVKSELDGPVFDFYTGDSPEQLASLRSEFDLSHGVEINTILYYVGKVQRLDIPSYLRLDTGVTWQATPELQIALWGQNLLDSSYPEASTAEEFPRGAYVMGTYRY